MKINIFSDGTKKDDECVAASLILTDNFFVDMVVNSCKADKIYEVELAGITQALERVVQLNLLVTEITCYTDSALALKACTSPRRGSQSTHIDRFHKACETIGYNRIKFKHMKAHLDAWNPNKLCDLYAYLWRIDLACGERVTRNSKANALQESFPDKSICNTHI